MIQQIEEFGSELQLYGLVNREHLRDCHVDVLQIWTWDDVPACIPESSRFVLCKRLRVEPLSYRVAVGILARTPTDIPDEVRPIQADTG